MRKSMCVSDAKSSKIGGTMIFDVGSMIFGNGSIIFAKEAK